MTGGYMQKSAQPGGGRTTGVCQVVTVRTCSRMFYDTVVGDRRSPEVACLAAYTQYRTLRRGRGTVQTFWGVCGAMGMRTHAGQSIVSLAAD